MEIRDAINKRDFKHYTTERIREECLIEDLFLDDNIKMVYSHIDRIITAGACPVNKTLSLVAGKDIIGTDYFLERRELGVINVGGAGVITVDGVVYDMNSRDGIYVGMNCRRIGHDTPCRETGECVDCLTPARMCNAIGIICADVKFGGRTTVIIVPEVGGF